MEQLGLLVGVWGCPFAGGGVSVGATIISGDEDSGGL